MEDAPSVRFAAGEHHRWWPPSVDAYDSLDPIGRDEFDAIVEHILMAAAKARATESTGL